MSSADQQNLIEKSKKEVSLDQWVDGLNRIQVSKQNMNKLVMNFFIIEGYKEAAETFKNEADIEISNYDLNFIGERQTVKNLIINGKIEETIAKLDEIDPQLLGQNQNIFINLQLYQLIELIKTDQIEKSIEFAQSVILPLIEKNPEFFDQLEQVMSLLAFQDLKQCPLQHLVDNSQKIQMQSEINQLLLQNKSNEKEPRIMLLMKLLNWSQDKLIENIQFPKIINLPSAEFNVKQSPENTQIQNKI